MSGTFTGKQSGFTQLGNGYYAWRKQQYNSFTLLALIPVKWNYSITNEYLVNSFERMKGWKIILVFLKRRMNNPVNQKKGIFFFIKQNLTVSVQGNNIVAAIFGCWQAY